METDSKDEEFLLYVSGGFLEVQANEVNILADTVIRSDDLDAGRIAKAKVEVKALLKSKFNIIISHAIIDIVISKSHYRMIFDWVIEKH